MEGKWREERRMLNEMKESDKFAGIGRRQCEESNY